MVEICRCAKALFSALSMSWMRTPSRDGRLPVDRDAGLQAALLAIGGHVDEPRDLGQPLQDLRHPGVERVELGAPERELVVAPGPGARRRGCPARRS